MWNILGTTVNDCQARQPPSEDLVGSGGRTWVRIPAWNNKVSCVPWCCRKVRNLLGKVDCNGRAMVILNPFRATLEAWTGGQTFWHLYPRFVPSTIDRRVGQHKRWISYYIDRYECRLSLLISESKQRKILANFYFCFAVDLDGLVCKLAVQYQNRYTKRVDLPTDVAVQVVSLFLGGVVYPW